MLESRYLRDLSPAKITGIYVVAGALWIALSDRAAQLITEDPTVLARIQTFKGWVFVALTGVLVYALSRQSLATARTSAAQAREGRRFLATLVSNLPGMVYRCLADARWTMEFVSEGCRELTGYDRGDLTWNATVAYEDLIHHEDRAAVRREIMAALEADRPFRITYRITVSNGTQKRVGERGRGVGKDATGQYIVEGYVTDVSAQRREARELELLTKAVEQVEEAVLITDPRGTLVYVNPAFTRITGYSRDEVLEKNPRFLQSGKQDQQFYRVMWDRLERGQTWSGSFVNRRKDETLYDAETVISPVKDDAGTVVNYVAVQRDVSEERQLQEQLRQAQKMELVGRLTGGIAHDFNNLLAVVWTNADLLLQQLDAESGETLALVQELRTACERGRRLIRRLLAFARREQLDVRPIDLGAVAEECSTTLGRVLPEHIVLETAGDDALPAVNADPGAIEQILMNLATNARDAMPQGGRLTISVSRVDVPRRRARELRWLAAGQYVCISVTDTGVGMDPSVRARIFEPFFTTKPSGVGTGLGMSMVYGLVKQQGGFVDVQSTVGTGSTIRLFFPRARTAADRKLPEPERNLVPATKESLSGTETVLVVEDDRALREAARRALSSFGYRVLTAGDGEEAIEIFQACAGEVDLVFSDVTMPRLGGPGLYHALQAQGRSVPFLLASGYGPGHTPETSDLEPDVPLLQKPWTVEELLRLVRRALDHAA